MKISNGGDCDVFVLIPTWNQIFIRLRKRNFNKTLFWDMKPKIVLCDDAKVSKFNLSQAISFWNRAGYGVSTEIIEKECESDHLLGEIRITSQRDLDLQIYYGFTERKISEGILFAATIKIEDASSNNLKLVIHELGHALGIEHSHFDKSHIMHPHVIVEDTRLK